MNKKTHEEYITEVKKLNPNIEVVERYINSKTAILHKCKIHQLEWKIRPEKIISGHILCPMCAIQKRTKTHEQYIKEEVEYGSQKNNSRKNARFFK